MVKVVYNDDFGGFSGTWAAKERGRVLSGNPDWGTPWHEIPRTDPTLVQVVEEGLTKDLAIRDIPAGSEYRIDEYDGAENVVLKDEYDWLIA